MRIIGLWGGVFALILALTTGFMAYQRNDAEPLYWMVFSGLDNANVHYDIFRVSPNYPTPKNLTQSQALDDVILTTTPPAMLVVAYDNYGTTQALYWTNLNAIRRDITPATPQDSNNNYYAWSPQNRLLLYTVNNFGRNAYLGVIDREGKAKVLSQPQSCERNDPLTNVYDEFAPTWSPDGAWIYMGVTFCDSSFALYRMRPDGSARQRVLDNYTSLWRIPDGAWILFQRWVEDKEILFRVRPDGSELTQLTEHPYQVMGITAEWLYLRTQLGDLYRMRLDGTGLEKLTDKVDASSAVFTNNDWLYISKFENDKTSFYRLHSITLTLEYLATRDYPAFFIAAALDDQWFYFADYDSQNNFWQLHQARSDGTAITPLKVAINTGGGTTWLPHPQLPWHPEIFAFGVVALGLLSFGVKGRSL